VAERALHRIIADVDAPDSWYLKQGLTAVEITEVLVGRGFLAARRIGKLLLLDVDDGDGDVLGLRFGMTGTLEVDGHRGVNELRYASTRLDPAWVRFGLRFTDGGALAMRDPRRLGGVVWNPPLDHLGPDASTIGAAGLRDLLAGSHAPLKARLMDQARLAGLGNLLTDEILWRAGLDPARPAGSLTPSEIRRLHRHLRTTLDELAVRGGSHTGDLMPARARGASCPRCGGELLRRQIGGRTTYSCARHQQ
jgi:formamidopyrimidine-DNA glycosylase